MRFMPPGYYPVVSQADNAYRQSLSVYPYYTKALDAMRHEGYRLTCRGMPTCNTSQQCRGKF